jgi:hypothetical protein
VPFRDFSPHSKGLGVNSSCWSTSSACIQCQPPRVSLHFQVVIGPFRCPFGCRLRRGREHPWFSLLSHSSTLASSPTKCHLTARKHVVLLSSAVFRSNMIDDKDITCLHKQQFVYFVAVYGCRLGCLGCLSGSALHGWSRARCDVIFEAQVERSGGRSSLKLHTRSSSPTQ